MAPPSFADLGKTACDVRKKGYHAGNLQLECKTKTDSGVKISTTAVKEVESGKFLAGTEIAFAWPDYGLKYVEKWNTDNQLVVDMSVEDKMLQGLKTSFVSSFNPSSNKKKGTVKTSYKNDYVNANVDVDLDFAGPVVDATLVSGYKGWLAGYQMAVNVPKGSLTANNFNLGYDAGDHIINASVKNGQDFNGSYFHRVRSNLEACACLQFSSVTKASQACLALKYAASPDTNMGVKAVTNGNLGLSLQQKIRDNISLTLSAVLNAKNLSGGGHSVGMSLEFEQ